MLASVNSEWIDSRKSRNPCCLRIDNYASHAVAGRGGRSPGTEPPAARSLASVCRPVENYSAHRSQYSHKKSVPKLARSTAKPQVSIRSECITPRSWTDAAGASANL